MDSSFIIIFALIFFGALWLFISFTIYCIPTIVAYIRKHRNIASIAILNMFLGWTFFGWLAALLWSLNSDICTEE